MTDAAEQGMAVRREVLGDEHVDRAMAGTTEFTAPFQDLITRYAWGEIWSRPGLTRAERSMITLTALAALRQEEELAMHVRAALRNGLTQEQIRRGAAAGRRSTPASRPRTGPSPSPSACWPSPPGGRARRRRGGGVSASPGSSCRTAGPNSDTP